MKPLPADWLETTLTRPMPVLANANASAPARGWAAMGTWFESPMPQGALRLYLGEARVCGSCHKKDQPHNFERAEMMKCDRCHSEITWKPPKRVQDFDHDDKSQAAFPLAVCGCQAPPRSLALATTG